MSTSGTKNKTGKSRKFVGMNSNKKRGSKSSSGKFNYEKLELRQVLSAYFPAYVGGNFTLGDPSQDLPYGEDATFDLESLPGAEKTIYLDYDGHHSVDNRWDHDIRFDPFDRDGDILTFSTAEQIEIQLNFQNVAEDFLPFGVNVTTRDPGLAALTKESFFDTTYGIRSVQTQPKDGFGETFGGIAWLNSFDDEIDNPVFTINKGINVGAMTISHEVGHSLGLRHDGLGSQTYHPGGGAGETSWGPIMGAPFGSNLTQWSPGDYSGSTNTEDDFQVITKAANGIDLRVDDHGDVRVDASALTFVDGVVFEHGIIGTRADVDFFELEIGEGNVQIDINAFGQNPNLDINARLFNASGERIAADNPLDGVDASFNIDLPAGTYFLAVEGVGKDGEYSDYGSVGFYTIEGVVENPLVELPFGEAGRIGGLTDQWQTVFLDETYLNPVVVTGPASTFDGDPLTIRVRNVTPTSFEVAVDEWEYQDGNHGPESVDYLVMEAGEYTMSDGTIIAAGTRSVNHRFSSVTYDGAFTDSNTNPVVLAQVMTTNNDVALTNRIRKVSKTEFQVKVQTEQAGNRFINNETVGWVGIERGKGVNVENLFEAFGTRTSVSHNDFDLKFKSDFTSTPLFFSSMFSYNGGDPATLRVRSISNDGATVFIGEEASGDAEMRHNREAIGYLAIDAGLLAGSSNVELPPYFKARPSGDQPLSDAMKQVLAWGAEIREYQEHSHDEDDHDHDHHDELFDGYLDYSKFVDTSMFDRTSNGLSSSVPTREIRGVDPAILAGAFDADWFEIDSSQDRDSGIVVEDTDGDPVEGSEFDAI